MDDQALALPDNELLKTNMRAIKEFQMIVHQNMVEGHDYGVIPGTGNKPTLLKPGAEKITKILGLADTYEFMDKQEDWNKPFFRYLVRCTLTAVGSGLVVTQGIGECNSYESKYRYRWVYEKDIPQGIDKSGLASKQFTAGTRGKFSKYRLDNDDIFSQVNTLVKMGCKRALIAAALSAGRLSEIFTQDMEDVVEVEPAPAVKKPAKAKKTEPANILSVQILKLEDLAKAKGANIGDMVKAKGWSATKPSELSFDQAQVLIDEITNPPEIPF